MVSPDWTCQCFVVIVCYVACGRVHLHIHKANGEADTFLRQWGHSFSHLSISPRLAHGGNHTGRQWPQGRKTASSAATSSCFPMLGLFLYTCSTDQDADSSNGCRDWKCFHLWLPLHVDTRGTLYGQAIMACLSHPLQIQNLPNRSNGFRLATSSTSGLVSSSPALAGSIDTGLSLIAMLKGSHVH